MWYWLVTLGMAVLLGACASTPPPIIWEKASFTVDDFRKDRYACVQQSRTSWSGGGTGLYGVLVMANAKSEAEKEARRLFVMCIEARGYTSRVLREGEEPTVK
jgi:hypothetical protein